jgi:hypothetical protein
MNEIERLKNEKLLFEKKNQTYCVTFFEQLFYFLHLIIEENKMKLNHDE